MAITKVGEAQEFGYKGSVEAFVVPFDGLYQLEVWGAQGGNSGGKGGYSVGYKMLNKGTTIYVGVGGQAKRFNGAGGGKYIGGGLTHIGFENKELKDYNESQKTINTIIVAGGGGGTGDSMYGDPCTGGYGGGLQGGENSPKNPDSGSKSYGGTQTAGGYGKSYNQQSGMFGRAGWREANDTGSYSGGGGGGWWGGHGGGYWGGGSGGSGYIGSIPAITFKGVTYSPTTSADVKTGDGKALITFIEKSSIPVALGDLELMGINFGDKEIIGLSLGDTTIF